MRLPCLITSDLHFTDSPNTSYRWGLFPWLHEQIKKHHVKTLLILGDLTDQKDRHSSELVNKIVKHLNELPIDDVKILCGNHDWLVRGQEFFRFLNSFPHLQFITSPWEDDDVHGESAFFLPYSKNPVEDWKGMDFSHYSWLFMHQTIKGAVASNGQVMDGETLPPLNAAQVYSGDIHVPQVISGVTYVGSPMAIHFGDNFKPRAILLDRNGVEHDLHFETIKRVVIKVTSLQGCQDSQEVPGEVVCLVGMSAGMRDAFNVLPLRNEGGTWVGVERKNAQFAGPSPAEAQAMIRAWAKEEVARNPEAAKDVQMQEAQSTMQVKAVNACDVKRKTGYLVCDMELSMPSRPDGIKTELTFMLDSGNWRYVPR